MDVSRRGLAGVVAGAVAGGKEIARELGSIGAGVAKSSGSVDALTSALNVAPDPLYHHPLASAFRAQWEYRRRLREHSNGYNLHPSIRAIKSYSDVYRVMKDVELLDREDHWIDALKKHLGIPTGIL